MKKILFLACTVMMLAACTSDKSKTDAKVDAAVAGKVPAIDAPKMKFEQTIFDFGQIKQGESVHFEFKFKNVGKSPLIISAASATCGCTEPEYPKTPVKPGESGVIKVTFNSSGKEGMQDKQVFITSNADPEAEKLHLVGEVKVAK